MRKPVVILSVVSSLALSATSPLLAQLHSPLGQVGLPGIGRGVGGILDAAGEGVNGLGTMARHEANRLLRLRDRHVTRLLRQHRDLVERDANGDLARRGEILVTGPTDSTLAALQRAGFSILSEETVEGLGLAIVRLEVPQGLSLARAEALARRAAPEAEIAVDNLHWQSGARAEQGAVLPMSMLSVQSAATSVDTAIGVIDGAPNASLRLNGSKGFARGAPLASDHGSAIVSLLQGEGARRLWVADVYGNDPAGGNALAIVRALGWLATSGCKVVTISLVGPRNAVLERAIAQAQQRGIVIIAAVGNDGPAARPAYPASYAKVVSVTGVDRKGRVLIEAGRALHLDYAAPGADVHALNAKGRPVRLRGTSFATPLVAVRLADALARDGDWRKRLDREARDLGPKGPDNSFGRGLLCGACGRKP
jgi:subtilisin family serine protease